MSYCFGGLLKYELFSRLERITVSDCQVLHCKKYNRGPQTNMTS
jgi:hypothetical protein